MRLSLKVWWGSCRRSGSNNA